MSVAEREGTARISAAFDRGDSSKRAALMPYLMGGFPTLEESAGIAQAYVRGGADVIELGMPYSDP
ncbi:MAG: tryptophan synthase subunit alpha, partial [Solirubrobacteraceae bacterium]